ncbi:FixJ family two-component response regulator [Sphingomicrobium lutaoense]|uniref:FixJ family two-component response regulator n=1 Tax=Sphingomicrobium lutaoense TaxID=515949 RepID=A0A839Z184_9SPHN|nr:FixJ family two-component response regulator [Sphingomicrobium lutaoense]
MLQLYGYQVHQFRCAEAFLDLEPHLQGGVVLADLRLPNMSGLDMVAQFAPSRPDLRTIVLTAHGDVNAAVSALRVGAKDFLHKPYKEAELVEAIEKQAQTVSCSGYKFQRQAEAKAALEALTPREFEVAQLLSEGRSNKEVAHLLDISVRTAEMHRARAMERLGVRNLAQLVAVIIRAEEESSNPRIT